MFSAEQIKKDFPIFQHHPELVYLDSTATSLKPQQVLDAERQYYEQYGVNVHRGVYTLSTKATDVYEGVREKVRQFINAKSTKEIIFTRNATEAINVVAYTFGKQLGKGDTILVSEMEHHSNIVPWQRLKDEQECNLEFIPVTADGQLDMGALPIMLNSNVKLVAIAHMSNVLGVVNDVKEIIKQAHKAGALVLVDAAQSVPHLPVDVQDMDADFLVFSGHKMLAPTGTGVLYAKQAILESLPPFLRGGDMILEVTKDGAKWNELPWRFEAGTPNIAGTIGLGAAIDYLQNIGMSNIWAHEQELTKYGLEQLGSLPGVTVLGAPPAVRAGYKPAPTDADRGRGAIFAFSLDGVHPHDIGSLLDERGIAIRAGHHCAMILHKKFGLPASARASCYVYNTKEDVDALVKNIKTIQEMFA